MGRTEDEGVLAHYVGDLQEAPSTTLTGPPRVVYLMAKWSVVRWEPCPCPPRGEWPC